MNTATHAFCGFTYFARWGARCKTCKATVRQEYAANQAPAGWYLDETRTLTCECGATIKARMVIGRTNSAKACDGRCMNAHGGDCECSCGGENHGVNS